MYPLPLLVRVLHTKWRSSLLYGTWKIQHRKIKVFFLKCISLGESNGGREGALGLLELEKARGLLWHQFSLYSYFNTSVMAWAGWQEAEVERVSKRQLERIMQSSVTASLIKNATGECMKLWLSPLPKSPGTGLLFDNLNMALDTGYVSEDRRRQANI